MWSAVAAFLGVVGVILGYLFKKEKTKTQKAVEIITKERAAKAKDKYYGQVRDTEEQEKRNDRLLADVAAILSVRKKANSGD